MTFDRQNSNDPTFHSSMHSGSTLAHNHPSMHGAMFQNNLGLAWPPSLHPTTMDLHSVGSPTSPDNTGLSSLPSPPPGLTKHSSTTAATHPGNNNNNTPQSDGSRSNQAGGANTSTTTSSSTTTTTNAAASPPVDMSKPYHSEWGVMKEQDFHPLTLKHQRDLENIYNTGNAIADFYFWQANLGGYCMADMVQSKLQKEGHVMVTDSKI